MKRLRILLALAIGIAAEPLGVSAQRSPVVPVIGYLDASSIPSPLSDAFVNGLRDLGYVDGRNVQIEFRAANANLDRLPQLAEELVERKVDVIVATVTSATMAAKNATRTIPIVMVRTSDPVGVGLVASLAQPGGNVTGLSEASAEASGKRLEILREIIPGIARVGILWNPDATGPSNTFRQLQAAATTFRLDVVSLEVKRVEDIETAFRVAHERTDGAVVVEDLVLATNQARMIEAAAKYRVPTIYANAQLAEGGGLLSYGTDVADLYRRAAIHVDRILKGARPADLPVQLPIKFELTVNLKTAKALGISLPQSILVRADEVIE